MKNVFKVFGVIALAAVIGFSFAACSGGDDGTGTGGDGTKTVSVTGVTLNKNSLSLTVEGSETLTATVAPDNATNKAVTWSTSNAAAATVANGVVTAVAAGTATITVKTADGGKTDTCAVTVYAIDPGKTPITTAEIDITAPVYGGVPATAISGEAEHFTAGTVAWSPSDNPFKPGTEYTATVTLTAKDGYTFTASTTATVNGQTAAISNITGGTITLAYKFQATSTKKVSDIAIKTPPNNLTYTHGEKLDLSGMTVTLTYDDTTTEDVAAANFTAKGITASPSAGDNLKRSTHNGKPVTITYGSLTPITTGNLTVNAKNASTLTIDVITAQTYTGSEIKPVVTVKDGAETLTLTADYTVSYSDNTVAGTATVTVTGTGDYTGSKTANFTINKANPSVTAWPTATAITYGAALSASALSGGDTNGTFAWTTPATIPTVSNSGYSVTFTPTDTANYNTATITVSITVNKANPTVTAWPTAAAITYGKALSASALSGDVSTPAGTFAWTTPATIPTVSNSGYSVKFTPTDTANYNSITGTVSITVTPADLPGTITISPNSGVILGTPMTATYSGGETVSYQWKDGTSNVGTNSNKYTPTTAGSYTVTVSATNYNSKTSDFVTVVQWTAVTDSTFGSTLGTSTISAIAYGNNKFVAVGNGGKMAYSTDGATWTAVPPGTGAGTSTFGTSKIRGIAYGNYKFVAGGEGGKMAYSTDGTAWTTAGSTFGTSDINGIAYGNNKFVAVGRDGKMAYSTTNGITWTAVSNSTFGTSVINAIAYGNNMFVAVGNGGKMATSTNGTTWTAVPNSTFGTSHIYGIAYGNNKFVAGGEDGKMAYSTDGTAWTAVTNSTFGTSKNSIYAITYGNGKFVAGGEDGKMAVSTDGTTWTAVNTGTIFDYVYNGSTYKGLIRSIAYGNGKFVAGGESGKMAYLLDN